MSYSFIYRKVPYFLSLLLFYCCAQQQTPQQKCQQVVDEFVRNSASAPKSDPNHEKLLYLFHIPKTAGRNFFNCFWKPAVPVDQRCARAYDWLHVMENPADCRVMASHEDYSVVDYLPQHSSFTTILREPVTRVISSYEFALEVALRSLRPKPALRSQGMKTRRAVQTKSVWPWMHLVPILEEDTRLRLHDLEKEQLFDNNLLQFRGPVQVAAINEKMDMYNNPFYITLEEFIETEPVADLIHNGAAFQLLGITNFTHGNEEKAALLRECAQADEYTEKQLLQLLENRLQGFLHVGLTERLEESLNSFVADIGWDWGAPGYRLSSSFSQSLPLFSNITEGSHEEMQLRKEINQISQELQRKEQQLNDLSIVVANRQQIGELRALRNDMRKKLYERIKSLQQIQDDKPATKQEQTFRTPSAKDTTSDLGQAYRTCEARSKEKAGRARDRAVSILQMKDGRGVKWDKDSRGNIPKNILDRIAELNKLDVKLYEFANDWLEKRILKQKQEGTYNPLPLSTRNAKTVQFRP
eukprot:TRINITY_DN11702_c0_g2_i1.p1 TRINITY_DN11702_c0_g2~~TRINITY_DN11702_c0_g2_i1.p1  ORF type:complete len:527 (-),score=54.74 TRINITY_DN11702_c0_g2_i1:860-2440(-)